MVQTLHATPGGVPDHILRGMFAARESVFIDLLKWDVPVLAGLYEIDQFDNEHARYLVLSDDNDDHMASARLLPTTREHIVGDIFPSFARRPPPGDWAICWLHGQSTRRKSLGIGGGSRAHPPEEAQAALAAHFLGNETEPEQTAPLSRFT
jgi:hypothetical protein